jgi:hypothetical protein
LNIETAGADENVEFNFAKWREDRTNATMAKQLGMSPEEMDSIRSGFRPQQEASEFVINPRTIGGSRESNTLTQARVAAEYSQFAEAAATGDAQAIRAYDEYKQNVLPVRMRALEVAGGARSTDLNKAWANLTEAQDSGDVTKIAEAQAQVDNLLLLENLKAGGRFSNQTIQFRTTDENGNVRFTQGRKMPTASGVTYVDEQNRPLQGQWEEVSEREAQDRFALAKLADKDLRDYRENFGVLASGLNLVGQLNDIVEAQPLVLTSTAGAVGTVSGALREAGAVVSVLRNLTSRGGPVSEAQLNRALVQNGVLKEGETLDSIAGEAVLGQQNSDLASIRRSFESKMILASYRLAGLEGQRGQGLSDKDVARMDRILSASTNPDVFRENLAEYFRDKVETVRRQGDDLRNFNPGMFREQYGYNPMQGIIADFESDLTARPEVAKGYQFVMNTGSTVDRIRSRNTPQQPPASAPAPAEQAAPSQEAVTISTDEEYQRLPSGALFIAPDGTQRRKP